MSTRRQKPECQRWRRGVSVGPLGDNACAKVHALTARADRGWRVWTAGGRRRFPSALVDTFDLWEFAFLAHADRRGAFDLDPARCHDGRRVACPPPQQRPANPHVRPPRVSEPSGFVAILPLRQSLKRRFRRPTLGVLRGDRGLYTHWRVAKQRQGRRPGATSQTHARRFAMPQPSSAAAGAQAEFFADGEERHGAPLLDTGAAEDPIACCNRAAGHNARPTGHAEPAARAATEPVEWRGGAGGGCGRRRRRP